VSQDTNFLIRERHRLLPVRFRTFPQTALLATASADAGTLGTCTDVTPAGIDLDGAAFDGDNFGVQDVLADPARPSDLYAFTCHQGCGSRPTSA